MSRDEGLDGEGDGTLFEPGTVVCARAKARATKEMLYLPVTSCHGSPFDRFNLMVRVSRCKQRNFVG